MGHGHEGHHHELKIPSADIYKIEDTPYLKKVQEKLAKQGLKDPWLRNHVWRYNPKYGTEASRWFTFMTRGMKIGIPAFLLTIAAEKALGIDYGHGHHGDHGEGGHH